MKKVLLILMGCLLAFGMLAQDEGLSKQLKETRVEPPRFDKPAEEKVMEVKVKPSPICCYVENELEYPDVGGGIYNEGIVGVEFTVDVDGTVKDFIVTNPVSSELDRAVIDCLRETNGMWIPGKVNGQFTPMQKLVYVKFDVPGNPSHTEMATHFYINGTELFQKAMAFKEKETVRTDRKAKRGFRRTMATLDNALKFSPEDPSVIFWQAATYEQQGNVAMMNQKIERYIEIVNATGYQRVPEEALELATIVKVR